MSGAKISHSEFLISTSFHHCFSISDNWDPISSDEFPCRPIPIRFRVARTLVFKWYRLSKISSRIVDDLIQSRSCNTSLRHSSSSSFLFVFSVSADPRDGFPRDSSLIISLLPVGGFSVLTTVSCDEDVEETSEGEGEELVDRPWTTNGT